MPRKPYILQLNDWGEPLRTRGWSIEDKIRVRTSPEPNTGCWFFTGALNEDGYGMLNGGDFDTKIAHRIAYRVFRGEMPPGTELDHLCRQRSCINPDHLEPVPHKVNVHRGELANYRRSDRKTVCKRGHPLVGDNIAVRPRKSDGGVSRTCRICLQASHARFKAKRGKVSIEVLEV